jgi:hypothetical protein
MEASSRPLKVGLVFFLRSELAEGLVSLCLHRRPQVLLTPLPDRSGWNRLQGGWDHFGCRARHPCPHREHQAGKATLGLMVFKSFEGAKDGFTHLTASQEAFVGSGFGRLRRHQGE